MNDILIYTKDYCPYCTKAKTLLEMKKQTFKEIDITHDTALQEEMLVKSNGRKTVPQIFINGTHVGGCEDMFKLNEAGGLDKLLNIGV
jgi:glutaredoxin 3